MRRNSVAGLALFALLALGCGEQTPLDPSAPEAMQLGQGHHHRGAPRITVMSRNLYIGADVDKVIQALASADPADDIPALLAAVTVLQETDFPTRAAAIAEEIAQERPDIVGLQEVTRLDVDLQPLGQPVVVHQDFLAILQAALASRGLHYTVAATVTNTQAAPVPGISLVDMDAVLVGPRVAVDPAVVARNYTTNIGPVAPGVTIIRGWVAIQVTVRGESYTIASTHLESGAAAGLDQLRAAQALELVSSLGSTAPAVLLGDFNAIPGSLMHQAILGAGFTDVWADLRPWKRGYTCCQVENLSNRTSILNQRIDYVFARGTGSVRDRVKGAVELVGERHRDRVPGPVHRLWPSDHAGIVATLFTPRAWDFAGR
ncbi:MAG TPA: endonuclease/exonuclease/phosphatase family protein [Gemmatimonadales bacterium]|jgi:endonuclease/exonuclease/phosphatase family metal-dependent hydrolase